MIFVFANLVKDEKGILIISTIFTDGSIKNSTLALKFKTKNKVKNIGYIVNTYSGIIVEI